MTQNDIIDCFKDTFSKDLFNLVSGRQLGTGIARQVFVFKPDPTLVIKFEPDSYSFQNIKEWDTWERVRWVIGIHKWFAPCVDISPCGTILLQKRVDPLTKPYPVKMPAFLSDFKPENYGKLNGRVVCCDYGTNAMIENGMTKRMRKAIWNT